MVKISRISVIQFAILLVIAGMVLATCNVLAKPGGDVPVLVSSKSLAMEKGGISRIKISGNNILQIKYSSSDKRVADVNKKGKITAKSTGVCKININVCYKTAKNSRRRKKLMVNVSVKPKEDNGLQTFKIIINKKEFDAELYNTDAAKEFYKLLPMKIKMNELNGNEKFYYMDKTFTEDKGKAGTINTGDIMLYGNNCIVLFYETFQSNYTYTRIGYIKNPSGLAEELGKGDVEVSFSK